MYADGMASTASRATGSSTPDAAITVRGLVKRYGPVEALPI